jgi:hypothetical protein
MDPKYSNLPIIPWVETFIQVLDPTICIFIEPGKALHQNDFAKAWQRASSTASAGKITQKIGNVPLIHFKPFSLRGSIFK